jgi:hypothetical protein
MSSDRSKPSKWWFWAFPLAGLGYWGVGLAIGLLLGSFELVPRWLQPLTLVMWPLDYFDEHVFGAVCDVVGRPANGLVNLLAFLALWEGCWALLGLFAYRVVRGRLVKTEAPEKAPRPSKWWFWWPIVAVNACALSFFLHHQDQGLWSRPLVWLGLLFWEVVAMVLGLVCYRVAAAVCARRAEGKESMTGTGKTPSRWWFWGVVVAANAYPVLALASASLVIGHETAPGGALGVVVVFTLPAFLFVLLVASLTGNGDVFGTVLLGVLLWELLAVLLGWAFYSLAAVIHARRSTGGKQGDDPQA